MDEKTTLTQDARLNALAAKLRPVIHGENLMDVATVCARITVFAIAQAPQGDKNKVLLSLFKSMRKDLKAMLARKAVN